VEIHRDHRPATEGLRAFAQRRALVGEVVAVPSPIAPEQDRLVVVEGGTGPVTEGMEYVESTEAELRRVTDLVIEHARGRPERSLAVLTFTEEHARRLMERIMNTVSVIPALRGFFDPDSREVFTVMPAAQASSLIRDDIIASISSGKPPHGRLLHRFGPLSEAGGRKALATVITRARGRTTVVSSLDVEDLDPSRLRTDGAHDLRAMLWVLRGGPDVPVVAHVAELTRQGQQAQTTPAPPHEAPRLPSATDTGEQAAEETAPAHREEDAEELSDEALDAAIEAALVRKSGENAASRRPRTQGGRPRRTRRRLTGRRTRRSCPTKRSPPRSRRPWPASRARPPARRSQSQSPSPPRARRRPRPAPHRPKTPRQDPTPPRLRAPPHRPVLLRPPVPPPRPSPPRSSAPRTQAPPGRALRRLRLLPRPTRSRGRPSAVSWRPTPWSGISPTGCGVWVCWSRVTSG